MNKTMTQISNATRNAKLLLDTDPSAHFPYSSFGNGKYQVSLGGAPSCGYSITVSYRGTCVVQIYQDNTIRLYARGYHTLTTKNVINAALFGARSPFSVYQSDFAWYVHNRADGAAWIAKNDMPFTDNMVLSLTPQQNAALAVA